MAVYTNEDGTVTFTVTHHISMASTVSLIKPLVIDDDDNGTPEDIFISVPTGNEHWQDKKVNVKIDTGAGRNIMSIKTMKELFGENGTTQNSCQIMRELWHQSAWMLPDLLKVERSQISGTVEHYQCQQVPHTTQLQNQH